MNPELLKSLTLATYHDVGYGEPTIQLAGMNCNHIEDAHEAVVGDFVYHYSSQLDAFTLDEVLSVNGTVLQCQCIDSDRPSQIGDRTTHTVRDGQIWAYKVYRANPAEREKLERELEGKWQGTLGFISAMAGQRNTDRKLANRLFYVPPPPPPRERFLQRIKNLFKE